MVYLINKNIEDLKASFNSFFHCNFSVIIWSLRVDKLGFKGHSSTSFEQFFFHAGINVFHAKPK